jgi:hypothetical protein
MWVGLFDFISMVDLTFSGLRTNLIDFPVLARFA